MKIAIRKSLQKAERVYLQCPKTDTWAPISRKTVKNLPDTCYRLAVSGEYASDNYNPEVIGPVEGYLVPNVTIEEVQS